jgi:hypothetical protein
MGRYRYRSTQREIASIKALVLRVVGPEPRDRKSICEAVAELAPELAEDAFWTEKVSTACQILRKEGLLAPARLSGGRGRAWRGWKRV